MSDIYMLQNKLKKQPHRGYNYIQDINLLITLQKSRQNSDILTRYRWQFC